MLPTTDRDSVHGVGGQFGNLNNLNKNVKYTSINDIKFCFLNVCGLQKRLLFPEFIDIIKVHAIYVFLLKQNQMN
jgi:hypothetical protein